MMTQVSSGDNLSAISKSVGGDETAVKSALSMGLPMLLGSMSNTASKPGGTDMLTNMMAQTGGSDPMANLSGFLGSSAAAGGGGMLNSLLGSQLTPIQNAIAQKTGLPPEVVGKVLAIAAPMLMSYVGKMVTQKEMGNAELTTVLGEQSKLAMQSSPEAASMAKEFMGTQERSGGLSGLLKKLLKV
ncbi:MAG: DUF937 domain-containing protein [Methanomicrobia archaeon]|nr:DUF937 domain-containing protein [Methanomicrobia archaeon]